MLALFAAIIAQNDALHVAAGEHVAFHFRLVDVQPGAGWPECGR